MATVSGRLAGKTAFITGSAGGFGAGIAERFVREGATVIVADINLNGAQAKATELGNSALAVEVDVSQSQSVANAIASAREKAGDIQVLVNNAGIGHPPCPLDELSEEAFDRLQSINTKSLFLFAKHLIPTMKAANAGVILNIASTAGVSPRPNLTWYNASKGWVITATKSMAIELAPWGIRVNALNPVAGDTPLLATFMGGDSPERRQAFLSTIPLGRFSTPEDLGNAACFLCSDEASLITGTTLEVDGGRCI